MNPDRVAERIGISVPHRPDALLLGDQPRLMQQEIFQNRQFLRGEGQRLTVHRGRPPECIQGNPAMLQKMCLLDEFPVQQHTDAGIQLLKMKGLGQMFARAQFKPGKLCLQLMIGGKDEDRERGFFLLQSGKHL